MKKHITMSNTLSDTQENFLVGIAAGSGQSEKGFDQATEILHAIEDSLKAVPGWEVAWGPGIFDVIPIVESPANVMYLARNETKKAYFLAVAGTNPYSLYDWLYEDTNVSSTKPWPYSNAGSEVQIAAGIQLGLSKLQAMVASDKVPGAGKSLLDFLTDTFSDASAGYTMRCGGHSLGGALGPVAGLWLRDTQDQWDPQGCVTAWEAWPSAGFTPGTGGFANYYNSRIPNTVRIHNSLDVVPLAWNRNTLESAKTLYAPQIQSSLIDALIDVNIQKTGSIDYEQIGDQSGLLPGVLNSKIIKSGSSSLANFAAQMNYQHVDAYYKLLGVDDLAGNGGRLSSDPAQLDAILKFFSLQLSS
jgi:hypothetical protein